MNELNKAALIESIDKLVDAHWQITQVLLQLQRHLEHVNADISDD